MVHGLDAVGSAEKANFAPEALATAAALGAQILPFRYVKVARMARPLLISRTPWAACQPFNEGTLLWTSIRLYVDLSVIWVAMRLFRISVRPFTELFRPHGRPSPFIELYLAMKLRLIRRYKRARSRRFTAVPNDDVENAFLESFMYVYLT